MKSLNPIKLAFTFAGLYLGAGYVSGQELYQFFGNFGPMAYAGLCLTMFLIFIFGYMIIRVAQISGIKEMDKIIVFQDLPKIRGLVGIIQTIFIFGIVIIMCAGTGALLNQTLGIPTYIGSGCFAILLVILACRGIKGLVSILSTMVPILIAVTVIICIIALLKNGLSNLAFPEMENTNPLLNNWLLASIIYVTYSLFCEIGILTPLAHLIDNKKATVIGVALGSFFLLCLAGSIIMAMAIYPNSINSELPMLAVSTEINTIISYVYAVLLFLCMLSASLSSTIAIVNYGTHKFGLSDRKKPLVIIILVIIAWLFSLFGFGDLIGVIYPICGYFGCFALLMVTVHYFKLKIKN